MADSNKSRLTAKEKGLCIGCCEPLDRVGVYCTKCLVKERERHKRDRLWYIQNGRCPNCRKEKIFGDERSCPECLAKGFSRRERQDKEKRKEIERKYLGRRKEIREEYYSKGICFQCRKRKIEEGKKKCRICLDKDAQVHRKRYVNRREEQVAKGMCYQCIKEKATKGKLCESCYDKAVKNLELGRNKANFYATHRLVMQCVFEKERNIGNGEVR